MCEKKGYLGKDRQGNDYDCGTRDESGCGCSSCNACDECINEE